ncbi:inositol monophosphatase family protein [Citricoccus muralis]|uniref:Myo-inositol-1(Or 4)-monophosphatase n=1 Tax=Citricoccus muralis TaxID=169134 RepID=A0A3D9L9U3_9MICC|nr:inositol monophosphatase family protein [Citricoccus muralis]REE02464.1 myo-inositol-1(or 4)-monophosphatase [Citricoccus muralis]
MSAQGLLAVARAAARAGAAVLAERPLGPTPATRAELGAVTKSSGSDWVTDYDRRAEQAVREVITAYRPNDAISGEEYGHTEPEHPSGYRWSIDPLDGTTNFIRGIAQFCTSVAVEGPTGMVSAEHQDGETRWLAGAVVAPALGRTWYASAGGGAFSTVDTPGIPQADLPPASGEPVQLNGPLVGRSGRLLATGFAYAGERRDFQLGALAALMPHFGDVRRIGAAALDLCMVADGTLDAYAEFGIQEHDWAAGALIAEEAGVPVQRPASGDGTNHPGWTVAGVLDPSEPTEPTGQSSPRAQPLLPMPPAGV